VAKQEPSPRQREIVDAVAEHRSVAAAASALGITSLTVDRAVSGYHRRVCAQRLAELEAEVARLQDKVDMDRAAQRLERVVGRIERAMTPVRHRRLADGGTHVSQQQRQTRTRMAHARTADDG
jgi:DNA-binding transcriptional LysR family regulator